MKKGIRFFKTILLIQTVFISSSFSQKSIKSKDINCSNLDSVNLVLNHRLMDNYISYVEENNLPIPIFGIKSINVVQYQAKIEGIKQFRQVFDEQNDLLKKILENDKEYNDLRKAKASKDELQQVYSRLWSTNSDYKSARILRDKALNNSNLLTLKYIYNKFITENKMFPTDFISDEIVDYVEDFKDRALKKKCEKIRKQCEKQ